MMKDTYTRQMNQFCESNCSVTAQDILQRAACPEKVASFRKYRRSPVRLLKTVAACIAFVLITAAAVVKTSEPFVGYCYEPAKMQRQVQVQVFEYVKEVNVNAELIEQFVEVFTQNFEDEKTVEIVEQGYVQEFNNVLENDLFSITLVGITGDQSAPKVVFDVTVKDEEIAALNDHLYMQVYTLGVEQYKYELDHYAYYEMYVEKDPEVGNLYHGACDGAPVWLSRNEEAVIAVKAVRLDTPKEKDVMHDIWFEYTVKPNSGELYPTPQIYYEDVSFEFEDSVYHLNMAEYSYYFLCLHMYGDYVGADAPTNQTEAGFVEARLQEQWNRFVRNMSLEVDGEEYSLTSNGYLYIDDEGESGTVNRFYVHPEFPPIDYETAQSIVLKAGEQSYELK